MTAAELLEAAARAIHASEYAVANLPDHWDELREWTRDQYRANARAALLALLPLLEQPDEEMNIAGIFAVSHQAAEMGRVTKAPKEAVDLATVWFGNSMVTTEIWRAMLAVPRRRVEREGT